MVRFHCTLGIAALLTLPQLILAASSVPPKALAQVEASVDFCVQVDSPAADKYKEVGKAVVANMSEKELKDARESAAYKQSYNTIRSQMQKVTGDKAVETCHAAFRNGRK